MMQPSEEAKARMFANIKRRIETDRRHIAVLRLCVGILGVVLGIVILWLK